MLHRVFFIVLLGGLALIGCNEPAQSPTPITPSEDSTYTSRDLEDILNDGTLTALVDNGSSSYFVYKGQPLGFEYEMLEQFANHLNVELNIQLVNDIDSFFLKLDEGKGDIMAANITITKERKGMVSFSEPILQTHQVLVQRLPKNFRRMSHSAIQDSLLQDVTELNGKKVHVRSASAFHRRLEHIEDEIGGIIHKVDLKSTLADTNSLSTELLIKMVAEGHIDYTVADQNVALLNKRYYPNIDVNLPISFEQNIAWALRKQSPQLLDTLNKWLVGFKKTNTYATIKMKYFSARTAHTQKVMSDYSSLQGNISAYDNIIKKYAKRINWDWRLLAAMIYKESQFDPYAESWTGARGLMQMIPSTAASFGVDSVGIFDPEKNIAAGTEYLAWLGNYWGKAITDSSELKKFILASYNVGLGHVIDARNLAMAYDADPNVWDKNVDYFLLHKSNRKYYTDPVVKHGYCRGSEPYNYVKDVLSFYNHYANHIER